MTNFRELPYNRLQAECKLRGIKANQKILVLIEELEKSERSEQKYEAANSSVVENAAIPSDVENTIISNFSNLFSKSPVKETPAITITPAKFDIDKILVFINGSPAGDFQTKEDASKYIYEIYEYIKLNDPTRILNELPDLCNVRTIDIQMKEKFEYVYGKGITKDTVRIHNGKEVQSIDAIFHDENANKPCWVKQSVNKKSSRPKLNRKKTDFEIGMISPSSRIENSSTMNASAETVIRWYLYDFLQVKNTNVDRYHPEYIKTLKGKRLCPYVQHVRVNEKFIISGLKKLKPENISQRTQKTSANKFKSGLLNGWSMPFEITLLPNDFLADRLGDGRHIVQVALEENESLNLYLVDKKTYREVDILQVTHHRTKLLQLGTVVVRKDSTYNWVATKPHYEELSKQLNKYGKLLPSTNKKYLNLKLEKRELVCGDRVLCKNVYVGDSTKIEVFANKAYEYISWLQTIITEAKTKMLNNNTLLVEKTIDIQRSDNEIAALKRAHQCCKKSLQQARSVIRHNLPDLTDDKIHNLAIDIVKHCYVTQGLNRSEFITLTQPMKQDVNHASFLQLVNDCSSSSYTHLIETKLDNGQIVYR